MAVYVDDLMNFGWKLGKNCHLVADSTEELKQFAVQRLGMQERWFQKRKISPNGKNGQVDHFDLTASRRAMAISKGAVALDRASFCKKLAEIRESYLL